MTDFLIHSRGSAKAADADDDPALDELHWSYMDGFADDMTARGPTLGPDRLTWTGSVHVVNLPDSEAVREFVAREPYNEAGMFEQHRIWRFTNILGQTMWEFTGPPDEPRFLIIAEGIGAASDDRGPVALDDLPGRLRDRLIVYGELRSLDDEPAGAVLAVQISSRESLDALVGDRRTGLADCRDLSVLDWELGGRR